MRIVISEPLIGQYVVCLT